MDGAAGDAEFVGGLGLVAVAALKRGENLGALAGGEGRVGGW